MSTPSPSPSRLDSANLAARERALLDVQLEGLARLAEMGLAMAEAISRRVTAPEAEGDGGAGPDGLHHAAMDFARVSRAVRMSYAMQAKLIADFRKPAPAAPAPGPDAAGDDYDDYDEDNGPISMPWTLAPDVRRRRRLKSIVRCVAEDALPDREAVERVLAEAAERLDVERYDASRPFGEAMALICRDLGLEPDWDQYIYLFSRRGWAIPEETAEAKRFMGLAEDRPRTGASPPAVELSPSG